MEENIKEILKHISNNNIDSFNEIFNKLNFDEKNDIMYVIMNQIKLKKIYGDDIIMQYIKIFIDHKLNFISIPDIKNITLFLYDSGYNVSSNLILYSLKIEHSQMEIIKELEKYSRKYDSIELIDNHISEIEQIINAYLDKKFISSCFYANNDYYKKIVEIEIYNRLKQLKCLFGLNTCIDVGIITVDNKTFYLKDYSDKIKYYIECLEKFNNNIKKIKKIKSELNTNKKYLEELIESYYLKNTKMSLNHLNNHFINIDDNIDFDKDIKDDINIKENEYDTNDIISEFMDDYEDEEDDIDITDSLELIDNM